MEIKSNIKETMSHKTISGKAPSKFAILSHVNTVILDLLLGSCHSSSFVLHDCSLKFSKQKLSYFESFQSRPKGI